MQLLCSTGTISRNPDITDYQQVLRYGPQLAVEGFELMFYEAWYSNLDRIASDLQQSGLKFPAMHTEKNIGVAFGSMEAQKREQGVHNLAQNCQLAQAIGTQILVLHLWGWPQLDDNLENNLQPLTTCLDVATQYGVKLAIETIPGRKTDPLSNVFRAIEHDPRCTVALDTEFLANSQQLDAVFDANWLWQEGRVRHVHIKDFDGHGFTPDGKRRYLHPGEGHINFTSFFANLKEQRFDGYISLEAPAIDQMGNVDIQQLNESLEFVKQIMQ